MYSTNSKLTVFSFVLLTLLAISSAGFGQERVPIAGNDVDPVFARYVDFALLGEAVNSLNPAALADAGLQLAEGERILGRRPQPAGLFADRILLMAYELAKQSDDQVTLARLTKAAQSPGGKALADAFATADRLAGDSRSLFSLVAVPPNVGVETFRLLKAYLDFLRRATLLGDGLSIDRLIEVLEQENELPSEQVQVLKGVAERARAYLEGGAQADGDHDALVELANRALSLSDFEYLDDDDIAGSGQLALFSKTQKFPDDPFFDRYFTSEEFAMAWEALNSGALADVAIRASEGERILHRERYGISAHTLWRIAIAAARRQADTDTLGRLQKDAENNQLDDLTSLVISAKEAAEEKKERKQAICVNPAATSLEEVIHLRNLLTSVHRAVLVADRRYLADVVHNLPTLFRNAQEQQGLIEGFLAQSLEDLDGDSLDANVGDSLDLLLQESRSWPRVKLPNVGGDLGRIGEKAKENIRHVTGKMEDARQHAAGKAAEAGEHIKGKLGETLAHELVTLTAEWQYQAWVPDPQRRFNLRINGMHYDTSSRQLRFHVFGTSPLRVDAAVSARMGSVSFAADCDLDFSIPVWVEFNPENARLTGQPGVGHADIQLRNLRFNATLADLLRGWLQDWVRKEVRKQGPAMQRDIQRAVSELNATYDGQRELRRLAEAIRSNLPSARAGVITLPASGSQSILGRWETQGRTAIFDGNTVSIRTSDGGQASFRYTLDPSSGILIGVDANGQRTETTIRWLSPNSIEWISPTGRRQYVRVGTPAFPSSTVPPRIELEQVGYAVGGVLQSHVVRQLVNRRESDSGRETLRLRTDQAIAIFAAGRVHGMW